MLNLQLSGAGFVVPSHKDPGRMANGVFTAGAVAGPMSIPEAVADAGRTVWDVVRYLEG